MVSISKSNDLTTTISFFKIDSEYQKKQIDLLREFIDNTLSKQTGFVSSTIHRSLRGSTIVNYSQWTASKDNNTGINYMISPEPKSVISFATHELNPYEIHHAIGDEMIIAEHDKVVTAINYVKLDPKNQANYTNEWINVFENVMKKQPSFISAILHKSVTGNRLLSYSHWAKREDLEASLALPEVFNPVDRATNFSRSDWSIYEVSYVNEILKT
ncbi:MAG: antibiotic biosynthesis monooxygenase family protein [Nitrosotalea sp.]